MRNESIIDFFFRGRLDVSDDDTQLLLAVQNVSGVGNGFTRGRFEVNYEAVVFREGSHYGA